MTSSTELNKMSKIYKLEYKGEYIYMMNDVRAKQGEWALLGSGKPAIIDDYKPPRFWEDGCFAILASNNPCVGLPVLPPPPVEQNISGIITILEECLLGYSFIVSSTQSTYIKSKIEQESRNNLWKDAIEKLKQVERNYSDEILWNAYDTGCLHSSGWGGDRSLFNDSLQSLKCKPVAVEVYVIPESVELGIPEILCVDKLTNVLKIKRYIYE